MHDLNGSEKLQEKTYFSRFFYLKLDGIKAVCALLFVLVKKERSLLLASGLIRDLMILELKKSSHYWKLYRDLETGTVQKSDSRNRARELF